MRDRRMRRRFPFCALDVNVDPLIVQGRFRKPIDLLLTNFDPVGDTDLGTGRRFEFVEILIHTHVSRFPAAYSQFNWLLLVQSTDPRCRGPVQMCIDGAHWSISEFREADLAATASARSVSRAVRLRRSCAKPMFSRCYQNTADRWWTRAYSFLRKRRNGRTEMPASASVYGHAGSGVCLRTTPLSR